MPVWKHPLMITGGLLCTAAGSAFWIQGARVSTAVAQAQEQLDHNQASAAAETLEPFKSRLISDEGRCSLLLHIYFAAHQADRLGWAARACLDAHVETAAVYIGLAATHELAGRDDEALKLLDLTARRFDDSPDAYYRMAQIYRKRNWHAEAAEMTFKAAERTKKDQIVLDALELLSKEERWSDAYKMAERHKDTESDNPEIKLMIARALLRGGDQGRSKFAVIEAKNLLIKKPELKGKLFELYPEFLQADERRTSGSNR